MIDPNSGPRRVPNYSTTYNQTPPPDAIDFENDPVSPLTPQMDRQRPSLTLDTSFASSSKEPSPPPSYDAAEGTSRKGQTLPDLNQKRALQATPVDPEPTPFLIHPAKRESPPPLGPTMSQRSSQHEVTTLFPRTHNPIPLHHLNMAAAVVDCPMCGSRSVTRTKKQIGNTQHAWAIGATALTGVLGFVPYIMKSLKDVEHYCSACGAHLVNWHKSGTVEVLASG